MYKKGQVSNMAMTGHRTSRELDVINAQYLSSGKPGGTLPTHHHIVEISMKVSIRCKPLTELSFQVSVLLASSKINIVYVVQHYPARTGVKQKAYKG